MLAVLTPRQSGYTIETQPTFYWFTSREIIEPVEFVLREDEASPPLVRKQVPGGIPEGINAFSLADHDIALEPDRDYRWSVVALLQNVDGSIQPVETSGGVVRLVPSPPDLRAQLDRLPKEQHPEFLLDRDFWYDTLDVLAELIREQPAEAATWRAERARLLRQVGLFEAANYEQR